jgi:tetratricopeptide (TPR) repeat protein
VIGLIQVGVQARADRYTYIPLVGIFVAVAWLLPDPARRGDSGTRRRGDIIAVVCAGIAVVVLAGAAYVQTGYWKDSVALFARATQVTEGNALAYANLGISLTDEQRFGEAIDAYRESLRINMPSAKVHYNFAVALFCNGDYAESWKEIHLAEKYGLTPPEGFVQGLVEKMPDPAGE